MTRHKRRKRECEHKHKDQFVYGADTDGEATVIWCRECGSIWSAYDRDGRGRWRAPRRGE